MNETQKKVLAWFSERNTGALRFRGTWVWPQNIRDDAELAERVYEECVHAYVGHSFNRDGRKVSVTVPA